MQNRNQVEIICIEDLVPQDHLLRKIERAVDFKKIYDFVEDLYCEDNGRPSIDPVILFKMVLIQHLYGIRSLRRVADEVSLNVAYRWFLGYSINENTPHFSTLSYNFRLNEETVDKIFNWILDEIANEGYLNPEAVFIDGTHIKANANKNKKIKEQVPVAAKRYADELLEEINSDREAHGKKPFDDDQKAPKSKNQQKKNNTSKKMKRRKQEAKAKEVTKSTTDPESGLFVKGDHKRQFAYEAHTACEMNGYVVGVEVTPGNVHDSVAFDDVYDEVVEKYPEVKAVVLDAAYKTPHICKKIIDDERIISTAYKRPMTKEGNHPWYTYVYDEHYDCIICTEYKILTYSTTNREGKNIFYDLCDVATILYIHCK